MTFDEFLGQDAAPTAEDIEGLAKELGSGLRPVDKMFLGVIHELIGDVHRIDRSIELIEKRQRNIETEMRQVHEKISSIELTIANLRCMSESERINRKNMCDVINAQADQLDRLNRVFFDEEPEEVKE